MKMVSYQKLSKKAKRAVDAQKRGSWYGISPVTRKPAPPKAYNRSQTKREVRAYDSI